MSIMGFHVDSCAGLPPGAMLASCLTHEGKIEVTVRTAAGRFAQRSFTPEEMERLITRATLEYWDQLLEPTLATAANPTYKQTR